MALVNLRTSARSKDRLFYYRNPIGQTIKIEVYYTKGGTSIFTSRQISRGVFVSITPVKVELSESGFSSESFLVFSGGKALLCELKRFSLNTLLEVGAKIDAILPKVAANLSHEATNNDFAASAKYIRDCFQNPALIETEPPKPEIKEVLNG
jgi:hypothetical protein